MSNNTTLPVLYTDFDKIAHINQYPKGTQQVWSNWTPRSSRTNPQGNIVHFGLQYFIKKYLKEEMQTNFFNQPLSIVLENYEFFIKNTLGGPVRVDHIEALHKLGYLPLRIWSLPEGTRVKPGVPILVITNTKDEFFWLPNYLETLMSCILWKASTSATTAYAFRELFIKHAKAFGHTDLSFVDWQGHDFSMRGMSGLEDCILSGMGHLLSFSGTDTIPAIAGAVQYYNAPISCGGSVPATEHSVMSAGSKEGEFETFHRLITEVYPSGIVSIVSDTWDLWKVLTDYIPRLKDVILAREGKIVIRPDSGDPVKIICGSPDARSESPEWYGAARLLAQALGVKDGLINNAGLIYGDGISLDRADRILAGLRAHGLSPYNQVFGIGSYTYEYVTRDTHGYAMKATAVRIKDEIIAIYKDPVTDDGGKKSLRGIPVVYEGDFPGSHFVDTTLNPGKLNDCAFTLVFDRGDYRLVDFQTIRKTVRGE